MTVRIVVYLLLAVLWGVGAEVLLKYSLRREGELDLGWSMVWRLAHNPLFWVSCLCIGLGFMAWVALLSRVDLGVAWGLSSISYIAALLAARAFLGEPLTALRWIGIVLITAGALLLALELERQTAPAQAPPPLAEPAPDS